MNFQNMCYAYDAQMFFAYNFYVKLFFNFFMKMSEHPKHLYYYTFKRLVQKRIGQVQP